MPLYEFEDRVPSMHPKAFVHPLAVLIGSVFVEQGCYVGAGAVLRGDIGSIRIGKGSNVQENCVVHTFPDEWTVIHPDVHVGHSAVLHGCEIMSRVLIGMGSVLSDGVKVNSDCILAAASFVPNGIEIPAMSIAMGNPAAVVKPMTPEHIARVWEGLDTYQDLTNRYLTSFREIE